MSVAARNWSAAAAARRSRLNVIVPEHAGGGVQAQLERVRGVEQRLLVLLHVLVVGEREAVHHAVQRDEVGDQAGRLGPQQLGRVGVLLLGHDRRARRPRVRHLAEAVLLGGPQDDLPAQPRQMGGARRRRGQVVEHEVAVGDRVDGVLGHSGEAEGRGDGLAVGVEVDAGQRPRAQRQAAGGGHHGLEAARVAHHHPEVGQQMVAEVDRLGALHVGVARDRPVKVAFGQLDQRVAETAQSLDRLVGVRAHEHRDIGRHLVIARPSGVQAAADPTDDLGDAPLDRHVDVLVAVGERETSRR